MNSKLMSVAAAALVVVLVLGPSGSQGICINNFCDPNPLSPTSLACTALCVSSGYDSGICSAGSDPLTATCTCSGEHGDPTLLILDTLCHNGLCVADCTSCGYAHNTCTSLPGGNGRVCTCYN